MLATSMHVATFEPSPAAGQKQQTTILLVHGGALSHRMYKDVVPLLTGTYGYRVVTPDLPGHGESVSIGPFSFAASTRHLHDLIQRLRASDPNVQLVMAGISLGGQAVLDFLAHHPEGVGAALVSGAFIHPPDNGAARVLPKMPTEQSWLDMIQEDVAKVGMGNLPGIQNASFGFTFKVPHALLPPTLVVVGEHDMPTPLRDFDELSAEVKKASPKSESLVMIGAWHNHSIDVPEQFVEVLHAWIRKALP
ncbi:hypothetical protein HDU87_006730 [Geranomyces variabilis]|uniref:AB hydrolase-1 domain-containing protein n=1 Tax=Geranomyces variabilis TaxID=109894 RepID=A0AAD5XTT3_9FUNG|nr:hypothetical protein HDU87_006730 [Geranomyces variabilis]